MKTLFFTLLFAATLFGQGLEGKQQSMDLDSDQLFKMYGDSKQKEEMQEVMFKTSLKEILALANKKGVKPAVVESIFYIKGKKARFDSQYEGQKMTVVFDGASQKALQINWLRKEYLEIDLEKMKKMKKKISSQLQGMEGMMANLPPEARAAMEKMGAMPKEEGKSKVTRTGRKATKNGFACEEYKIENNISVSQYWITEEMPFVREAMEQYMAVAASMSEESGEKELWEDLDEGWPVVQKDLDNDGYGLAFSINELLYLKKKKLQDNLFKAPKDFKKVTLNHPMFDQ